MNDLTDRAWREIDLDALRHNARVLQSALAPGCKLMAVVKADGYGHGALTVAQCLAEQGVDAFATATLDEAVALRRGGVQGLILILGYTSAEAAPVLRRYHLTQTVADETHARALAGRGVTAHLALDTGMHRLGVDVGDRAAIRRIYALPGLTIEGVFSHLCVSDCRLPAQQAYTQGQLQAFYETLAWMGSQGLRPGRIHIQASYGIFNLPPQPCDFARAGIALYGVTSGVAPQRRLPLRPVLSLRARVATVRELPAGAGAGYGLDFRPATARMLATVTIGYADGLPSCLSQQGGEVLLRGVRCPMVGRMCMDQLLVDVTAVPDAAPGDVVTLIGRDGCEALQAETVAAQAGILTNELLSRLGPRLNYVNLSSPDHGRCTVPAKSGRPSGLVTTKRKGRSSTNASSSPTGSVLSYSITV